MTATPSAGRRRPQVRGHERDQLVAVAHLAVAVDGDDPVAVPVEGEADRRLASAPPRDAAASGCGRAAPLVDVAAVGLVADQLDLGAEPAEDRRRRPVRGAVRAVEHDRGPRQVERESALELAQVVVERPLERRERGRSASRPRRRRRRPAAPRSPPPPRRRACDHRRPKNLIPLSRHGLCEAEITAARSSPRRRTRIEAAGVGSTPASSASPPASADAGGERRLEHRAGLARVAHDQHLRPSRLASGGRGAAERERQLGGEQLAGDPANPVGPEQRLLGGSPSLTPVRARAPQRFENCGRLRAFLSPALRRSLRARVAGQQAAPLELGSQLRVDLAERAGDAVANGARLAGDAAAVDADSHVDGRLVAGGQQRLACQRLEIGAGEVLLERLVVDGELAAAGCDHDAGDRALALAGRLDAAPGLDLRPAGPCARRARRRPRRSASSRARSSSSASSRARSSALSSRSGSSAIGSRSAPGA